MEIREKIVSNLIIGSHGIIKSNNKQVPNILVIQEENMLHINENMYRNNMFR